MPLVHFVLFKTTLRKTFWPYMKILSKNTSLLPPESMIPPFHILFTPLFHFLPLLVLFHSFLLHSFIFYYIFAFISFPSASFRFISSSFRFISSSFRFISSSFRFISHHFASFRILVGPFLYYRSEFAVIDLICKTSKVDQLADIFNQQKIWEFFNLCHKCYTS